MRGPEVHGVDAAGTGLFSPQASLTSDPLRVWDAGLVRLPSPALLCFSNYEQKHFRYQRGEFSSSHHFAPVDRVGGRRPGGADSDFFERLSGPAYRTAQEVRGEADARATAVYADAYRRDANFYTFTKSLETYEHTADSKSVLILTTDRDLLRFLKRTP